MKLHLTTEVLILLFLFSCKKDDVSAPVDVSFLIHKWKLLSCAQQITLEASSGNYYFQFYNSGGFGLALDTIVDVNICGGKFNVPENEKIILAFEGCTKVCCDSNYARKLISLMGNLSEKNSSYAVKGDSLIISGTGNGKLILLKTN